MDYKTELDKAILKKYKIDCLISSLQKDIRIISRNKISSLCRGIEIKRGSFSYRFLYCDVSVYDEAGSVFIYFLMNQDNKKLSKYRKSRISEIMADNSKIRWTDEDLGKFPIIIKNVFTLSINELLDNKTRLKVE